MKPFLAQYAEEGFDVLQSVGVTSDHENQLAFLGAPVTAGDRRIEKTHAAFGRGGGNFSGERRGNGAGIDVGAAALERLHSAARSPEDFFEGGRITDYGEEKVGGSGDLLRGFCEGCTCRDELTGARGGAIPDRERVAGLDEIYAHGATHQAETKQSNFCGADSGFQRRPPRNQPNAFGFCTT